MDAGRKIQLHSRTQRHSSLVDGWRLRQYRDGEQVKRGGILPLMVVGIQRMSWPEDAANGAGQQWVEDNTPEAEISW